jgi:hypothetical protein
MRGRDAKSVVTARARNRALLARQLLLERAAVRPLAVVERLVGMQAQTPRSPYTALWSRIVDFDPMTLSRAVSTRRAVRIALMRSTIHLVTARDALRLRPLMAQPLARELTTPTWRTRLAGLALDDLAAQARVVLEEAPRTPKQLGEALAPHWPDREPRALAHAARCLLPLVQLPPRGTWDGSSATTLAIAEQWLGRPMEAASDWDAVALRYLAAFGPATAADMIAWSRVTGLGEVISRLRPRLRVLHDEDGRELFDLPRAARPPASTPAPPRFLPDYDNVLLAHADRSHVFPDAHRRAIQTSNGVLPGTVLVDGAVAASWSVQRDGDAARLLIRCLDLPGSARSDVREEGRGLLALLASDARRTEVTFSG